MDELTLINRIRDDCDDLAYREMLAQYVKMIESIVHYYLSDIGDYRINKDDLKQEAYIGLYEACKCYKDNMNTKFSTFAYTCIKRRVHAHYRKIIRMYYKEGVSLDNYQVKDSGLIYATKSEKANYDDKKEALKRLMTTLSYEDRTIVDMRIRNYSYKEISSYLNIKEKRVDNRLMRIKDKLSKSDLISENKSYT